MVTNNSNIDKKQIVSDWVNLFSDDLYSWALHKTSDSTIAEDIVQETFISAFTGIDKFRQDSNPKTWLFSILKNKIIDYYRKTVNKGMISLNEINRYDDSDFLDKFFEKTGEWKENSKPTDWNNEEHLLDNQDFNSILEFCLKELPQVWCSTILYKYIDNKDGKQICQELDISSSNYWQMLHRAKLQLRDCLEQNWFKEEK